METIETTSYAKVNLTLEVSAKRPDGYHDIDSVVLVIDPADSLVIEKAPPGAIEVAVDSPAVPEGRENLVYRACEAFFRAAGLAAGAKCFLRKRIPAQAGLGGGSGNAAAAIVALNRLYEVGLSRTEMVSVAAEVGSDVPLFIVGGTVRMRGRGEIVEPLPDAPEIHLVLAKPDAGVSTAWAYSELDRRPAKPAGASDEAEHAIRAGNRAWLLRSLSNDFDAVVREAVPEVRSAADLLRDAGAESVMLCGSGSAVFGAFATRDAALTVASRLAGRVPWVAEARGVRRDVLE